MSDEVTSGQINSICEKCKQDPCVCKDKNKTGETMEKKPRVKGSHRNGTPPKLKWM